MSNTNHGNVTEGLWSKAVTTHGSVNSIPETHIALFTFFLLRSNQVNCRANAKGPFSLQTSGSFSRLQCAQTHCLCL